MVMAPMRKNKMLLISSMVEQPVFKNCPLHGPLRRGRPQKVVFLGKVRGHVVPSEHEQGPTHGACHQGRGRLVNVNVVLQGDERIPRMKTTRMKMSMVDCLRARWAGLLLTREQNNGCSSKSPKRAQTPWP